MNAPRAPAHAKTNRDRKLCLWWIREEGPKSPWWCAWVCVCVCVCACMGVWMCVPYLSEGRVSDTVQVDGALVSQVVKDVEGTHRLRASLLVAENKVNPLMQLTWHKLAFQGLSKEYRAIRGERHTSSTQDMDQKTQHKLCFHTTVRTRKQKPFLLYTDGLPEHYISIKHWGAIRHSNKVNI